MAASAELTGITLEEVERILLEAGIAKATVAGMIADTGFQNWVGYLANQQAYASAIASPALEFAAKQAIWEQAAAAISGTIDDVAFATAQQGAQLVRGMMESQVKTIAQTIADGMAQGMHPFEIARRLDSVKTLDPQRAAKYLKYQDYLTQSNYSDKQIQAMGERFYEKLLADRRKTIARTETANAQEESARQNAIEAGAQTKSWITVGDDRVSDICQANEGDGPIPVDDEFDSGDMQPPAHPLCRCTLSYQVSVEQTERAAERAAARAEATAAAKAAKEGAAE